MKTIFLFNFFGPEMLIIFFAFSIFLAPMILYILTLRNTLMEISEENRLIAPSTPWLILIPIISGIFIIHVASRLSDSLKLEFEKRNIPIKEDRPAYNFGVAAGILFLISFIPFFGMFTGIAGLICWILHWVKVNDYKRLLLKSRSSDILDLDF